MNFLPPVSSQKYGALRRGLKALSEHQKVEEKSPFRTRGGPPVSKKTNVCGVTIRKEDDRIYINDKKGKRSIKDP